MMLVSQNQGAAVKEFKFFFQEKKIEVFNQYIYLCFTLILSVKVLKVLMNNKQLIKVRCLSAALNMQICFSITLIKLKSRI